MSDLTTQNAPKTSEGEGIKTGEETVDKNGKPDQAETNGELTFTPAQQAHLDRVIEERLSRQRAQFKKQEEDAKQKAEQQRMAEQGEFKALADQRQLRILELESDLKNRELNTLRATIAARHRLPEHWIPRLVGETEQAIDEDAARLAQDLAPPKAPNAEGGERQTMTKQQSMERARQEAMKSGRYSPA